MIGAPCIDIEVRRGTCADEDTTCFLVACSVDDGVETESDEEELEDDDIIETGDVAAPFVVVFTGSGSISGKLSSGFILLGDDVMTSEGNILSLCVCNSVNGVTDIECVGDSSSIMYQIIHT